MDKLDLETLPYPMFKTNWYEKRILRKALKYNESEYLCVRILHVKPMFRRYSFIDKVHRSCGGLLTRHIRLNTPGLSPKWTGVEEIELRKIWIRKLLEYKGE